MGFLFSPRSSFASRKNVETGSEIIRENNSNVFLSYDHIESVSKHPINLKRR